MASRGPDLRHVTPRASIPPVTQGTMSTLDLAATVARGVAAAATEILERFTRPPQVNEADHPPVDVAADAAIREHFQRCLAATPRATPTGQAATGRTSAFDWLGHHTPTSQEESKWAPHPEMTPCKIDRGRQPHKEQETERAVSQKRQSQSHPRDKATPRREGQKVRGSQVKSKLVLIGQLQVSRNPFPSRILDPHLLKLMCLEPVGDQQWLKSPRNMALGLGPGLISPVLPTLSLVTRKRGKSRTSPIGG